MSSGDCTPSRIEVIPTWLVILILLLWALWAAFLGIFPSRQKGKGLSRCPACDHPGEFPSGMTAIGCPYCGWESAP